MWQCGIRLKNHDLDSFESCKNDNPLLILILKKKA